VGVCIKQKKGKNFFSLLFSRTLRYARKSEHSGCEAKSSVQGLRNGAPFLKTDRFGDPALRHGGGEGFLTVY